MLGAILVTPKVLRPVLHLGLRSEHFYRDRHRGDLPAILELGVRGDAIDSQSVIEELKRRGLRTASARDLTGPCAFPTPARTPRSRGLATSLRAAP